VQKCSCRWKGCEFLPECCEKQEAPVFLIRFRGRTAYPTPRSLLKQLKSVRGLYDLFLIASSGEEGRYIEGWSVTYLFICFSLLYAVSGEILHVFDGMDAAGSSASPSLPLPFSHDFCGYF